MYMVFGASNICLLLGWVLGIITEGGGAAGPTENKGMRACEKGLEVWVR